LQNFPKMVYSQAPASLRARAQAHVPAPEVQLSPILVRPVREQLEHDRVIRLLQAKYKRKLEVALNPGHEQTAPVGNGTAPWYPDLVLQSPERGHKLLGTVEVETTESVNHLEAMSEWVTFSRLKALFHLYVPTGSIDTARRLCTDLDVNVAELWAYQAVGEQIRFTLIQRSAAAAAAEAKARTAEPAEKPAAAAKPAARPAPRNGASTPAARAARPAAASRTARRVAPAPAAARRKTTAKAVKTASRGATKAPAKKTASRSQKRR
jgi:hypothetical protein